MTFQTYDGLKKVQVAISENIVFGAELQTAKNLIDECINEWGADSRPEIVTLIDHAFQVDKEGKSTETLCCRFVVWTSKTKRGSAQCRQLRTVSALTVQSSITAFTNGIRRNPRGVP